MVETQVFYYTGMIIWTCICTMAVGGVLVLTIGMIAYVWNREKKIMWQWRIMAALAGSGLSQEELRSIALKTGYYPCDYDELCAWLKMFMYNAKELKKQTEPAGK